MKTHTKHLGLVKNRDDLTHEQFTQHWLGTHAQRCTKLPGLLRYSASLVDKQRFPEFGCDGFSELWFDSEQALWAALESPEGKTSLADLPNFAGSIEPIIPVETPVTWA